MGDIAKTWFVSSASLTVSWMSAEALLSCVLLGLSIFYTCMKIVQIWRDRS